MLDHAHYYRALNLIRRFEEKVLAGFSEGVFSGTTHTYLGQEANAVGVLAHLRSEDLVFSNHRCHGHFLAYGGDPRGLFAELMGRATGVCGGRGGSQHLHWRGFYTNGVLGSTVPIATGAALAEKIKGNSAVAVAFLGDGTFGEGVIYEAFNMAALWQIPILYVVENNRVAQTTPLEAHMAGTFSGRFTAFDIPNHEMDTSDVLEIASTTGELLDEIRHHSGPRGLILHTHRFGPHSKGDDIRPAEVIEKIRRERDPLTIHGTRLDTAVRSKIEAEVETAIDQAFQRAAKDPFPEASP